MQIEKKDFTQAEGGNFDDVDVRVSPNQWVNMKNFRYGSTDKGVTSVLESIGGTDLKSVIQPSVTFVEIGKAEDDANRFFVYFRKDLYGPWDQIVYYSVQEEQEYILLLSNQVVGGLNFDKNKPIHSARIVNGILYWVDSNNNEPRSLSVYGALKMNYPSYETDIHPYTAPINFSEITLIKPTAALPPTWSKETDILFPNNFIGNESFMFAVQFVYYTNEKSIIGTYSSRWLLNREDEEYNFARVKIPFGQLIPDSVRIVNLIVRFQTTAFVAKVWDREISAELTEITNHNAGITELTYDFYNNIQGEGVPASEILKPFDSVPVYSESIEVANSRLFLGGNTSGYDAPLKTSLEIEYELQNNGEMYYAQLYDGRMWWQNGGLCIRKTMWLFYLSAPDFPTTGFYIINSTLQQNNSCVANPPLGFAPAVVLESDLVFAGATTADVEVFLRPPGYSNTFTNIFANIAFAYIQQTPTEGFVVFKPGSSYQVGIVFYDYAMRKCGVVTTGELQAEIPPRSYLDTQSVREINWSLNNLDVLNEIPEWAYYYSIVRTLNSQTRNFILSIAQFVTGTFAITYFTKDADGQYVFADTAYNDDVAGIAISTVALTQAGLGYVYSEGDICVLTFEFGGGLEPLSIPVIGQYGNYILLKAKDVGGPFTSDVNLIFEIYTPYFPSTQEPFYEVGNMFKVLNPNTENRAYSVLSGTIGGDVVLLLREYGNVVYLAEAMSPNDFYYNRWDTDAGKPNYITKLGQAVKTQEIAWSNTFIPGTSVNGLSTFEALNTRPVPQECGPISKLQLTSKVQEEGDVMLAICRVETCSVYIGESRLRDQTGETQIVAVVSDVIGTINVLKGSFGTINPESVVEFRGNVFWYDALNGKWIQYSLNGLFPISNYKMTRYWKLFSDQYLSMTLEEIEALGSRPFIFATVDPHHWELLITVPKLLSNPPKGYTLDYPDMIYPWDIWDGQAKTLVYKLSEEPNFWAGSYDFTPEGYVTIQNKVFAFRFGQLYQLNSTTNLNNFFGVPFKAAVMPISNLFPSRPKVYNNLSIEASQEPSLVYFRSEVPYEQISDLLESDFVNKEGIYYAKNGIYRNKIVPSAVGMTLDGLLTAERMRTYALRVMIEFTPTDVPVQLRAATIGFAISHGHNT